MIEVRQQSTPSYDLGFTSGARAADAVKDNHLSVAELAFVAHARYVQASKGTVIVRDEYERGFVDGYQAYFDGII